MLVLLCGPRSAGAQPAGEASGSISDQTGAPLPGVRVTIRGVVDRRVETDADGGFAFPGLPEGNYEISAELAGFERLNHVLRVPAGERVSVSFTLRVGLREDMTVTAAKAGASDVQAIPMAVTAVSSAELARLGTSTLDRATALAPSVAFSQNSGFGQLTIRASGPMP